MITLVITTIVVGGLFWWPTGIDLEVSVPPVNLIDIVEGISVVIDTQTLNDQAINPLVHATEGVLNISEVMGCS